MSGQIRRLSRRLLSTQSSQIPSFPCLDAHATRLEKHKEVGTSYKNAASTSLPYQLFHSPAPLLTDYGGVIPYFTLAYETWGTLSPKKDNVILLQTGLSASSHARSTEANPAPGWWQKFVGPGLGIDTNHFFVICTNVLGGCDGSTGPSSLCPYEKSGDPHMQRYATRFPMLTIFDMVRAQYRLLDALGIQRLYAVVGGSMGGMLSLASAQVHPDRVGKVISISATGRSSPGSVAMRYAQRSVLMADENWRNGFYYNSSPPHKGMKLARQIATITYRSGPEWEQRFGRRRIQDDVEVEDHDGVSPKLCPDFQVESYIDHQGENFCLRFDANSWIYISKAMDLFDLTASSIHDINNRRARAATKHNLPADLTILPSLSSVQAAKPYIAMSPNTPHLTDLIEGTTRLSKIPCLILGVQSDMLMPYEQQRELADALRRHGDPLRIRHYELNGPWGHDTFLIDFSNVGGLVKGFL